MIRRDPADAAGRQHDLVIVGGGIYGACLALESARAGLRPLLLERGDFGEATSWNTLRILHGGLRYLQTVDITRFRESVRERRWFCRTFPELLQLRECMMPLYGEGLKRPLMFRAALQVNDLLSSARNAGVDPRRYIGRGRMLGPGNTVARFPLVDRRGLRGAAVWDEVVMVHSQRLLIEILRWACSLGATALNYVESVGLITQRGGIRAVRARDAVDGATYTFDSSVVCNCAGPWSAEAAARFGGGAPELFRPSLAFNVLLDREPPCASAIAVSPRRRGRMRGPVYFMYPAFGGLFAGTAHLPWSGGTDTPRPTEEDVGRFLEDLNEAVPGLNLRREQVIRVFAGLLPASEPGTAKLAVVPVIRDHAAHGGPNGLVSVSGVKFTTARLVAEKTLAVMASRFGRLAVKQDTTRPPLVGGIDFEDSGSGTFTPDVRRRIGRLVEEEAVMTVDDLLFRRTSWGIVERDLDMLRRRVSAAWPGCTNISSGSLHSQP